jgi:hypothetical protein
MSDHGFLACASGFPRRLTLEFALPLSNSLASPSRLAIAPAEDSAPVRVPAPVLDAFVAAAAGDPPEQLQALPEEPPVEWFKLRTGPSQRAAREQCPATVQERFAQRFEVCIRMLARGTRASAVAGW